MPSRIDGPTAARYCAAVRPIPRDGGHAMDAEAKAAYPRWKLVGLNPVECGQPPDAANESLFDTMEELAAEMERRCRVRADRGQAPARMAIVELDRDGRIVQPPRRA